MGDPIVRVRRWLVVAAIVAIAAVVPVAIYGLVVAVNGEAPGISRLGHDCVAPATVSADYGAAGYAVFFHRPRTWSLDRAPVRALVGRSPDYGVVVDLDGTTEAADVRCEWGAQGVRVIEPTGVVHSVPAAVFTKGR